MKTTHLFLALAVVSSGSLLGQETHKATFDFGAGFTESVGLTSNNLSGTGYNLQGGAGLNLGHGFGVKLDLGYFSFGDNSNALASIGAANGSTHIFSTQINPIYHIGAIKKTDFYVTGGGGMFRQNVEFSGGTLGTTNVTNSFFNLAAVNGVGAQIPSSYSVVKPGWDLGGGVEFLTKSHIKIFAEARYEHMFNTDSHTDFIPVTFGFRW